MGMACSDERSLSAVRNLPAYSFSYSTATRAGDDSDTLTKAMSGLSSLIAALWEIMAGTTGVGVEVGVEVGAEVGVGAGSGVSVGEGVGVDVNVGVGVAADATEADD